MFQLKTVALYAMVTARYCVCMFAIVGLSTKN